MTSQEPQKVPEETPKATTLAVPVQVACYQEDCTGQVEFLFTWPGRPQVTSCKACALRACRLAYGIGFRLGLLPYTVPGTNALNASVSQPTADSGTSPTAGGRETGCKVCGGKVKLLGNAEAVEHAPPVCGGFTASMAQFQTYSRAVRKGLIDDIDGLLGR